MNYDAVIRLYWRSAQCQQVTVEAHDCDTSMPNNYEGEDDMGMPLDLYVIRHGQSEANVIVQAGQQGDESLYTQDNVTVPDRSWRCLLYTSPSPRDS